MTRLAFKRKNIEKESGFRKFLKISSKKNLLIEINNLFAKKNIENVSVEDLNEIYLKYKIKSSKKINKLLQEIYENFYEFCLRDKKISKDEFKSLNKLKSLFDLSDKDVKEIEAEVVQRVYGETLDQFLKDDKLSDAEKNKLKDMRKNLLIDEEIAKEIYVGKADKIYNKYLKEAISDEQLSPKEEKQLKAIAKNLNIDIVMDDQTKHNLEKFKLFWNIDNGNLPIYQININLQKNETCHFMTNVNLYELRRVTKRINYGGPTMRIKITKGVYYRAGSLGIKSISDDIMTHIDSGNLFLTNKRIIFMGSKKNTNIRLNKVLDFEGFKNGVSISKDTGKSPFYEFGEDVDLFCVILGALLKNG